MSSTSLRDFEDAFLSKLDEYKKNPALFFIDILPFTTDRQKAMLWHFIEKDRANFHVDIRDSERFAHIAKLVFFNFLRFPDELTVVVFPANWIYAKDRITEELIKQFTQLKSTLFLGGELAKHIKITPEGLIRHGNRKAGIIFKDLTKWEIRGYSRETTYFAYGYQCFTSEQIDQLKAVATTPVALKRKLVFVTEYTP